MAGDSELLERARKLDRDAVEQLLGMYYPTVHRMALGLSGREDVGQGVVGFVMNRSLHVMGKWNSTTPGRWFYHHTVLTTRRAAMYPPDALNDVLLKNGPRESLDYLAFVRAVRTLPHQQREAFLLNQGEGMDLRQMAIAMDCSVEAAENHLRAAVQTLRAVGGAMFEVLGREMRQAYARLGPGQEVVAPSVRRFAGSYLWPRRLRRLAVRLALLALVGAMIWLAWRVVFIKWTTANP